MKKGFTLIELLAVIVILAIIALIATPIVLNIINDAKESSLVRSAEFYLNGVEISVSTAKLNNKNVKEGTYSIMEDGNICLEEYDVNTRTCKDNDTTPDNNELIVEVKGEKPNSGKISVNAEGKVALSLYNDRYYIKKNYDDTNVEVYEIIYYDTFRSAVTDINNDEIRANANATKATAEAGVYINKENEPTAILLKDTTENDKIVVGSDMTINLNGNTLTFENSKLGIDGAKNHIDTITIDGQLDGSTIVLNGSTGAHRLIQVRTNNIIINGGTYVVNDTGIDVSSEITIVHVSTGGAAMITNANLNARGAGTVYGVQGFELINILNSNIILTATDGYSYGVYNGVIAIISDTNITTTSFNGSPRGIYNDGTATISNSDIKAYSNYTSNYHKHSKGIHNNGTLTINDSYVIGTHSGIHNNGTLYIDKGIYEAYGNGGIYFSGTGTTSYVKNAIIRECDMPEGYTAQTNIDNNVGFRIGENANVINIYMDNNEIYGSVHPIILDGAIVENGNNLFISNSNIYTNGKIRIDNDTHKLYIGKGNNFTAENTTLPSAVENTDDIYTRENIEK